MAQLEENINEIVLELTDDLNFDITNPHHLRAIRKVQKNMIELMDRIRQQERNKQQADMIFLSKEQAQYQILLTLQALPMPKNFGLDSIAERIAEHLTWLTKEGKTV